LKSIILTEITTTVRCPIKLLYTGIATMKDMRNHEKDGCMPLVSITGDHTLKSRMMGNYHVRLGSGGGGSNPFANHDHHESSRSAPDAETGKRSWEARTPAMASGLTDHVWSVFELMSYKIVPSPWTAPKRRERPRTRPTPEPDRPKRPRGRPRKGVSCTSTS
jgi:hypothetical protein